MEPLVRKSVKELTTEFNRRQFLGNILLNKTYAYLVAAAIEGNLSLPHNTQICSGVDTTTFTDIRVSWRWC